MSKILCFGEVLWDVFPNQKKIGGAPLNVASRLSSFGNEVSMISAIGADDWGEKLLHYLNENKISTAHVQILHKYKTGKVKVSLDAKGSATYNIKQPRAWDKILLTDEALELVKDADALVFGS